MGKRDACMFAGIIEEVGKVQSIRKGRDSVTVSIDARMILEEIRLGDSIAVSGVCLTVTSFSQSDFTADVIHEALNRSSLGNLRAGSSVNLERAMPANDRFGGHIVSGYIDDARTISATTEDDNAIWYTVKTDPPILRYVIEKGSVAVDGISLTVAKIHNDGFSVSIIPHTTAQTILPEKRIGDTFNLENDCIAKCVGRLLGSQSLKTAITTKFLAKYGL